MEAPPQFPWVPQAADRNTSCNSTYTPPQPPVNRARRRRAARGGLMESPLLHEQSPAAYFKELLDSALARQHVTAGELTACYLVKLLCRVVRPDACESFGPDAEAPALELNRALGQGGSAQRAQLRNLGDVSLFVSGYFADSLPRRAVDVDYYVSMGEYAYGSLCRRDRDAFAEVFGELSGKFVGFTDVLSAVSEHTG